MSCNCLLVRIDPNDILSSTGNTLYTDNTVFIDGFLDCDSTPVVDEFTDRGYYCYCMTTSADCSICMGDGWIVYDETQCYREITTTATPPVSPLSSIPSPYYLYSTFGSYFYEPGFCQCGSGATYTVVTGVDSWDNVGDTTSEGPLNRCAIWNTTGGSATPYNKWLGFSACLSGITETKTYWVGIGADNHFKLILDGNLIVDTTLPPNPFTPANARSFKRWNVYPVEIGAGDHTLEIYGMNQLDEGGYGCEIYDGDLATLTGLTTYAALEPYIIFTTSGQTEFTIVQDLSGNYESSGYTCPSGYVYSTCDGQCVSYEYCETPMTPTLYYYQDDVLVSSVDSSYVIQDSSCVTEETCCGDICDESNYCISDTSNTSYDDNYEESGLYNEKPYWVGEDNGLYLYYSTGSTQWCLSSSLGGVCLLSGKSPCISTCPDILDTYLSPGVCSTTTTTTTINCDVLDFDAIFECEVTTTTSTTTTTTLPPTTTTTTTNICETVSVDATISAYTTTTTTIPVTTTTTTQVFRPCNFYGDVTFNTVNEDINCPISKQFQDCYNGTMYYTTNNVVNPTGGTIDQYMVFNATVDGSLKCVSYIGTTTQVIGSNNIILNSGPYGYSNLGGCASCIPTTTTTTTTTTILPG